MTGFNTFRELATHEGWTEQEAKDELYQYISDTSKAAQGFRCRMDINDYTLEQLEEIAKRYEREAEAEFRREEEARQRAVETFEANVARCIECGAADRATAIRWLWDAYVATDSYAAMYGWEAFEHDHGLPYGHMAKQGIAVPQCAVQEEVA
jgi:succinate dehydrogenase/fumarate reductase-like Fe-S protein